MESISKKLNKLADDIDTKFNIVYAGEEMPKEMSYGIFLAGPTPRDKNVMSWRDEALDELENQGFKGTIFVPEPRNGSTWPNYDSNFNWESKALNVADVILFWVPRDMETMPSLTTNVEFGYWLQSGKVVFGYPDDAPDARKNKYLAMLYERDMKKETQPTLEGAVKVAIAKETASKRLNGEVYVPLHIWNTKQFQGWYSELKGAGNRLDEAEQKWVFRMPKAGIVFSYVLWVKVWIEAEQRFKKNEWVFARSDISTVVLHNGKGMDSEVVIIREFRSPVRNSDGFVRENAGGSSVKEEQDYKQVAVEEVHEETGLVLDHSQVKFIGNRQAMATLSSHKVACYACKLTDEQMEEARKYADENRVFGIEEDSERTFLEIHTIKDILDKVEVDWLTVGTMLSAILKEE